MITGENIEMVVAEVGDKAEGIRLWTLKPASGGKLPPFTAGAHIDVHLPDGLVRSYSLCNAQTERGRYMIAVNRDPQSRGGSHFMHDRLKWGERIRISVPRNNFPLNEAASHSVFVAGGIGITPIFSMIQRLEELGRSWELHYSTRSERMCAFRDELVALDAKSPGRVHLNFTFAPGAAHIDLNAVVAGIPSAADIYCCGPAPMIVAFEEACAAAGIPSAQVHLEYFMAKEEAATEGGYTVVLSQSGKTVEIPAGKTILEVLNEVGVNVPFSCQEGVCGTCETRVIEGVPDHRDAILSPEEREEGRTMMICCSGSKTRKLVLDL